MNQVINRLIEQAYDEVPHERDWDAVSRVFNKEKFAKLLIKDICNGLFIEDAKYIHDKYDMVFEPEMSKLDLKSGDLMTVKEFISHRDARVFLPYDGSGNWATATHESNWSVWTIEKPEWATHVMWYNK